MKLSSVGVLGDEAAGAEIDFLPGAQRQRQQPGQRRQEEGGDQQRH
jgi:hypothetical protein